MQATAGRRLLVLAVAIASAGLVRASLGGQTWDGDANGNWDNALNWSGNTLPGYGTLFFTGGNNRATNQDFATLNMSRIDINVSTGAGFSFAGNEIKFFDNGGVQARIENQGGLTATFTLPINFAATAGANYAELNPVGGALAVQNVAVTGSAVNEVRVYGSNNLIVNGVISGTGKAFSVEGAASVIFNASNTYTGETRINGAGSIQLGVSDAIHDSSVVALNNSGSRFNLNGFSDTIGGLTGSGSVLIGATGGLTVSSASDHTYSGIMAGGNSANTVLTKQGTGSLTLGGVSTFGGNIRVTGGSVVVDADNKLGNIANDVALDGGTLRTSSTFAIGDNRTVSLTSAGGTISVASGTTLSLPNSGAALTGSGNFIKSGGGSLSLFNGITFAGNFNINGGTVSILLGNDSPLGNSGNDVYIDGGALRNLSNFTLNGGRSIFLGPAVGAGTGTFAPDGSVGAGALNIDGVISNNGSGTGHLAKTGSGRLEISGANTYTGDTTIHEGTLRYYGTASTQSPTHFLGQTGSANNVAFEIFDLDGGATIATTLNVNSGSGTRYLYSVNNSGVNTFDGNIVLNKSLTVQKTNTGSADGSVFAIGGSSADTISFNNDAGGPDFRVEASFGNITLNSSFINVFSGASEAQLFAPALTTLAGNNNNGSGGRLVKWVVGGGASSVTAFGSAANIGEPTGLYPDKFNFSGANTLRADATVTLDSNFGFTIASGVQASFSASNSADTFTIAGPITGSNGNVRKIGPGTVAYANAKTYAGTTSVNEGRLLVNGIHSANGTVGGAAVGAYTVQTAGVLGGTGTVNATVNVLSGGALSPGTSAGKLTLNGTTQLGQNGAYIWEINSQTGTPGVAWDLLDLDAVSVTATSTVGQKFTIKILSLNGSNQPGPTPGWQVTDPQNPKTFTIATSSTNAFAGVDLTKFAIDTTQFQDAYPTGWSLAIGNSGGSLDLVYVPEPGSVATVIGSSAVLLRRRRRV